MVYDFIMLGKRKIVYLGIIFLLILILILTVLSVYFIFKERKSDNSRFSETIYTQLKQNENTKEIPDAFARNLETINSSNKTDEQKYLALRNLFFYYNTEYSRTHDPKIKEFAEKTIGDYAKNNYEKYYTESEFRIPCADPTCGEAIDKEGEDLIKKINSSGLKDYQKETIITNFKTASYISSDRIDNKKIGMSLVVSQLNRYGDPVASSAAIDLKNYLKRKHKIDL